MSDRDKHEGELRVYTCCSSCALILGIIALGVNVLAVQEAEATNSDDNFRLLYRWDKISYEADITDEESGDITRYSADFLYTDLQDTLAKSCNWPNFEGVCEGMDDLQAGGEAFVGLASTAVTVIWIANLLQLFWTCMPGKCPHCTHWVICIACFVSAVMFWAAYGVWEDAFENNDAVDAAQFYLGVATGLNSMWDFTLYEPIIAGSAVLMILCASCAVLATCFGCYWSCKTQRSKNYEEIGTA